MKFIFSFSAFALGIGAVSSFSAPPPLLTARSKTQVQRSRDDAHRSSRPAPFVTKHVVAQSKNLVSRTALHETGDPRVDVADDEFKAIMGGVGQIFGYLAKVQGGRATHTIGTTARGRLTILSNPDIPAHKYLAPNRSYPVLVRHANIKGFKDDAIRDGRGLTLRLLEGDASAATSSLDLSKVVLDVLTSTGPCFILSNAVDFNQWVTSDMDGRGRMLKEFPKITPIFEEIIKNPDSYTKLHYYSEPSYTFVAEDGTSYYLRYRVINADKSPDTGFVPPKDVILPTDYIPRPESDTRPEQYLQDDFKARVTSESGVSYLLQVQLQPVSLDESKNQEALDCTIAWDEADWPFRDVGIIHLDEIIPDEKSEPLTFSPYHAPEELALVLASSAKETSSINQLRSVVYQFSASARNGVKLPSSLASLLPPAPTFPEVFKGVFLPNGEMPSKLPNLYTVKQVGKYALGAEDNLVKPIFGRLKESSSSSDSLVDAQNYVKKVNDLQRTVPLGGYKFFGPPKHHAKALSLLLKTNPFMASALTEADDGMFELKSYDPDETNPSRFLQYMRTLGGVGHRVNFKFSRDMEVASFEVFDDLEGRPIPGELDVQKWASSAIFNIFFYASCVHATLHVLQFLLTSAFEASSKDFEAMHEWAVTYAKNIGNKYVQVSQLLITDPQPPNTTQPALITNPNGFGSSEVIRPMLKDLLDTWGQSPTAEDFVANMMNLSMETMESADILTEFRKQYALIKDFAADASNALKEIDEDAFAKAEAGMKKYLKSCGSFKSNIDTVDVWVQLMSVTGITHGTTLSYTRFLGVGDVARWRNYLSPRWDFFDLNLIVGGLGTLVGMESGRHVYTSTGAPNNTFHPKLQDVLNEYDAKTSSLKADYKAELLKNKDFEDFGFILSDYGPDDFDGKQLTIATYI